MKEMKTRKMYEKPSMKFFPLRQKPALLVGSGGRGGTTPYDPEDPTTW